jgi:hypothetical protein
MFVKLSAGSPAIKDQKPFVSTWHEASRAVSDFIAKHDLTAGCGSGGTVFLGGQVYDDRGRKVGRISYNGRAWNNEGNEVVL